MFGNPMNTIEKAIKKKNAAALIKLADNSDMKIKLAAIDGLSKVADQDSTNFLVTRLHNEEPEVRIAVAQALGTIGDMHTKAFIYQQMNNEKNPEVHEALGKAMVQIKDY